jgi:hypothetical protein
MAEDTKLGQVPFVYLPGGNWRLYFAFFANSTVATGTEIKVVYESWISPGQSLQQTNLATFTVASGFRGASSGAIALAAGEAGMWIRPLNIATVFNASVAPPSQSYLTMFVVAGTASYAASAANAGTFTVTGVNSTSCVPVIFPSEFANSTLPWYSTRLTAVGALFTNVTQVLNKGGTVMGGRVSPAVQNPWLVTKDYLNGLHPAEKAFLAMETGMYTYCPPSTDMSEFWDYVSNTSVTGLPCPLYRLDNDSLVNIAFFTPGTVAASLALNCSWHIEFRTSSALFQIALCGLPWRRSIKHSWRCLRLGFSLKTHLIRRCCVLSSTRLPSMGHV